MTNKTVIFVAYSMGIGGVEKALLGVVNQFISDGWKVTIALLDVNGVFLDYLPSCVHITKIDSFEQIRPIIHAPMKDSIVQNLRKGRLVKAFQLALCLFHSKRNDGAYKLYNYAFENVPMFSDNIFDLAVSFAGPDAFIDFYVHKRILAREKWGWVHFDVSKFGVDKSIIRKAYYSFAKINIVSEGAKRVFDDIFPEHANRTTIRPNIIDSISIRNMSMHSVDYLFPENRKIILTVGRVCVEKGQYLALQAIKHLVEIGHDNFLWIMIGTGGDFDRCSEYIKINKLEKYVDLIGPRANPYPYIKRCDLYVQPSLHEGFCITLAEAKIFEVPIIATDFTGAHEQLNAYSKSWAISPHNPLHLRDLISKFL